MFRENSGSGKTTVAQKLQQRFGRRRQTKHNCNDFGEEEMLRWWREEDYD